MKLKFNRFERVAGVFVGAAIIGSTIIAIGIAIEKGWFASKVKFITMMESAEGIHVGTAVQIQGLRAGNVDSIELESANKIKVTFSVFSKFKNKITKDSYVQMVRPFVIGEKVLDIGVGLEGQEPLQPMATIKVKQSFDVMELMSGRRLGPFLGAIEKLAGTLEVLADAFADTERTKTLVEALDKLDPLITNMNEMSLQVTRLSKTALGKKRLEKVLNNVATLTGELNKVVPQMNEESPEVGAQLAQVVTNLNELTREFRKLTPAIATLAPELPKTSLRAVEALNEAVVLLKAMQKSWLLSGKVEQVLKEERERDRKPASE